MKRDCRPNGGGGAVMKLTLPCGSHHAGFRPDGINWRAVMHITTSGKKNW